MPDTVQITCPACLTRNRVPAARLRQDPKCGRCRTKLFGSLPITLTSASFQRFLEGTEIPIVVDFWAPWCGPCKMMAPAFEQAARALEPEILLAKVDTQAEPALGAENGIRGIPTLVLFKRGREIARQSGAVPFNEIVGWARSKSA